jgi:hypothetical protein
MHFDLILYEELPGFPALYADVTISMSLSSISFYTPQ